MGKGVFDRFCSLPIAGSAPLIGAVLGDLVRYTVTVVMVLLAGVAIGFRPVGGPTGVIAAGALIPLFAFALCWMSVFVGMIVRTPMAVQAFGMVLMFPLAFASPAFAAPPARPLAAGGLREQSGDTDAGVGGDHHRALLPARGMGLPAPHLTPVTGPPPKGRRRPGPPPAAPAGPGPQ